MAANSPRMIHPRTFSADAPNLAATWGGVSFRRFVSPGTLALPATGCQAPLAC
jgi:hypothetical protein